MLAGIFINCDIVPEITGAELSVDDQYAALSRLGANLGEKAGLLPSPLEPQLFAISSGRFPVPSNIVPYITEAEKVEEYVAMTVGMALAITPEEAKSLTLFVIITSDPDGMLPIAEKLRTDGWAIAVVSPSESNLFLPLSASIGVG
jgi:hypothetical protein